MVEQVPRCFTIKPCGARPVGLSGSLQVEGPDPRSKLTVPLRWRGADGAEIAPPEGAGSGAVFKREGEHVLKIAPHTSG